MRSSLKAFPYLGGMKGFMLLEVIVAIGILAIGFLGVAKMQMTAISKNGLACQTTIASSLAQEKMEYLMALQFSDSFTDPKLRDGTHLASNQPKGYTILWHVTDDTPIIDSKNISVTVMWSFKGQLKKTSLNCIKAKF